jgi:hypothetical protein
MKKSLIFAASFIIYALAATDRAGIAQRRPLDLAAAKIGDVVLANDNPII